ncbi:IMCp domain-containing protein [Cohnella lupini]|uniref:Uncharacterized protein n=1 Tax=Cohnella lupini TaxID=1294267 RepID=A0A3D9I587_9BACL|nr:IMCp domain-containing protein [Cohnella lupini]RED56795.1 hypothetical protein DFP95_11286 [Cohnella lupini]
MRRIIEWNKPAANLKVTHEWFANTISGKYGPIRRGVKSGSPLIFRVASKEGRKAVRNPFPRSLYNATQAPIHKPAVAPIVTVKETRTVDRERVVEKERIVEREIVVEKRIVVEREKIVEREKVVDRDKAVDRDRIVERNRIVERDKPVDRERIVERDKPVDRERIVERDKPVDRDRIVERRIVELREVDRIILEQRRLREQAINGPSPVQAERASHPRSSGQVDASSKSIRKSVANTNTNAGPNRQNSDNVNSPMNPLKEPQANEGFDMAITGVGDETRLRQAQAPESTDSQSVETAGLSSRRNNGKNALAKRIASNVAWPIIATANIVFRRIGNARKTDIRTSKSLPQRDVVKKPKLSPLPILEQATGLAPRNKGVADSANVILINRKLNLRRIQAENATKAMEAGAGARSYRLSQAGNPGRMLAEGEISQKYPAINHEVRSLSVPPVMEPEILEAYTATVASGTFSILASSDRKQVEWKLYKPLIETGDKLSGDTVSLKESAPLRLILRRIADQEKASMAKREGNNRGIVREGNTQSLLTGDILSEINPYLQRTESELRLRPGSLKLSPRMIKISLGAEQTESVANQARHNRENTERHSEIGYLNGERTRRNEVSASEIPRTFEPTGPVMARYVRQTNREAIPFVQRKDMRTLLKSMDSKQKPESSLPISSIQYRLAQRAIELRDQPKKAFLLRKSAELAQRSRKVPDNNGTDPRSPAEGNVLAAPGIIGEMASRIAGLIKATPSNITARARSIGNTAASNRTPVLLQRMAAKSVPDSIKLHRMNKRNRSIGTNLPLKPDLQSSPTATSNARERNIHSSASILGNGIDQRTKFTYPTPSSMLSGKPTPTLSGTPTSMLSGAVKETVLDVSKRPGIDDGKSGMIHRSEASPQITEEVQLSTKPTSHNGNVLNAEPSSPLRDETIGTESSPESSSEAAAVPGVWRSQGVRTPSRLIRRMPSSILPMSATIRTTIRRNENNPKNSRQSSQGSLAQTEARYPATIRSGATSTRSLGRISSDGEEAAVWSAPSARAQLVRRSPRPANGSFERGRIQSTDSSMANNETRSAESQSPAVRSGVVVPLVQSSRRVRTDDRPSAPGASMSASNTRQLVRRNVMPIGQHRPISPTRTTIPGTPSHDEPLQGTPVILQPSVKFSYALTAAKGARGSEAPIVTASEGTAGEHSQTPSMDLRRNAREAAPAEQAPSSMATAETPVQEINQEQLQRAISALPQLDPDQLADQVYKSLMKRMKFEQRLRGF